MNIYINKISKEMVGKNFQKTDLNRNNSIEKYEIANLLKYIYVTLVSLLLQKKISNKN